jgi:hypothetical protein
LTPEVVALNREAAKMQAETALMQAKESYLQAQLAAKLRLQDLAATQEAKSTAVYQYSLAAGYAVRELWAIWILASVIGVAYAQRARWTPQVAFTARGIETTIPAKQAVALVRDALKIDELEISQKMLSAEAEIKRDQFQEVIGALRALKSFLPKEKPAPVIELPIAQAAAIPARSLTFSMADLLLDPDLEPGTLPLGRNSETGAAVQTTPEFATSFDLVGKPNHCKTTLLKMLCAGFFRLQDAGKPVEMALVDPHAGLPDSLALFLKPVLNRFEWTVLGEEAIERGDLLAVLQDFEQEAGKRQATGENTPLRVLVIDELHDILDQENGKATYTLLKKLRRLRKAGFFQAIVWHDSTKEGQAGFGTGLMGLNISAFVVSSTRSKAAKLLEEGDAEKAVNLPKGQAVLKLPGCESEIVSLPMVREADLLPFIKQNAQEAPGATDAPESGETPDAEAELTPAAVKTFLAAHADYSQNKVADAAGIPRKTMSFFMNDKTVLKPEEANRLRAVIFPAETTKIVNLNQYRKTLEN